MKGRRWIGVAAALVGIGLGFLIVVVSAFRTVNREVVAGEQVEMVSGEEVVFEVEEATDEAEVEYQLAYPGILPDHPLYWLKMVRDRVWGWLVFDPVKKADWLLLMADKRIWAAEMLLEKGMGRLAVTTASKAEKYLERAVLKLKEAEIRGREVAEVKERMGRAVAKHRQVLRRMVRRLSGGEKEEMRQLLDYPARLEGEF